MRRLLNFGVSDPLTLGMAHPIADRLEILGRARPVSKRSRAVAFGFIGLAAMLSAPLTIAADHPDKVLGFNIHVDGKARSGQSYEITNEDGVKKAYRILENGDRREVNLDERGDGSYRLTYEDGQIVDIPHIDLDGLEGLKSLENLKALKGLKSLEGLAGLDGLAGLEGLSALEGLSGLSNVIIRGAEFDGAAFPAGVKIIVQGTEIDVTGDGSELDEDKRATLQNLLRKTAKDRWFSRDGDIRTFTFKGDDKASFSALADTIVTSRDTSFFGPAPEFYEDVDAEIEALMADSSVDIRTRKAKARRMKAGALQAEFRRFNPAATREERLQNCISILDTLNRDYRYHNQSDRGETAQTKCERSNVEVSSRFSWSSADTEE